MRDHDRRAGVDLLSSPVDDGGGVHAELLGNIPLKQPEV